MASLTLNIPDAQLPRLVAAVAQQRGKDISALTNAQKIQLMKDDLIIYWKGLMQASEIPAVQATAAATQIASIDSNLQVT